MDGTEQIAFQTHADCSRQAGRLSSGGAPRADWSLKGRRRRLAIGGQLADRLQRVPWSAGGDVVDARARLGTNRVRQVRAGTGSAAAMDCTACAGIRVAEVNHMRYRKGMIALSETRDYPLLRRVLHSSFVTPAQLYEFMKLDYCSSSRNAFDNRLRRLLDHDLLVRHEIPTMNRGVVYSISRAGASELVGRGEYYAGSTDIGKESNGHMQHALELNDIHLALKQSRTLVRWTPESDIRSRNEFTGIGFVKDYDAVVAVRLDDHEYRFALEYERTQKANVRYLAIQKRIQAETDLRHFLYLVSNYDLLLFLVKKFEGCRRPVYFGLRQDFLIEGLCLSVQSNHSPVSTTFLAVLARGLSRPSGWRTSAS